MGVWDLVGNFPGEGIGVAGLGLLAAPGELLPGKGIDHGGIWTGWGGQEEADCPALLSMPIWGPYVVVGPLVVGVEDAAPRGGRGGAGAAALLPETTIPAMAWGGSAAVGTGAAAPPTPCAGEVEEGVLNFSIREISVVLDRSMVAAWDGGLSSARAGGGSSSICSSRTPNDHGEGPAPSGSSILKGSGLTLRNSAEGSELRLITCIWIFDPR